MPKRGIGSPGLNKISETFLIKPESHFLFCIQEQCQVIYSGMIILLYRQEHIIN